MISNYIDWNFPLNDSGEDDGLNNPGIETFKNSPIISLAREICQNSLDAKDKSSIAPVEIHFTRIDLPRNDFPNLESFIGRLEACKAFNVKDQKVKKFIDAALEITARDRIPCFKISDFNTTGLTGVGERDSDWYKLTKKVGGSDKPDGLGSFGIGKFAPYAFSDFRTVFYNTKNLEGQYAFQGVSRLISHEINGNITRGTGYYGISEKNNPITEKTNIPDFIKRDLVGTDIFITGFKDLDDWEEDVISAVVTNFFYAIKTDKLVVKAGNKTITSINLPGVIEKLKQTNPNTLVPTYYEAITSVDSQEFINEDFMEMGKISLKVILGKDYPKKVAIVRGAGMNIFDRGHFDTTLRFSGVFYAAGDKINQYLKTLEPPAHDKFIAERADTVEEKKKAKLVLKNLYDWIKENIYSIATKQASEESDIEGISKFLPDDVDDFSNKSDTEDLEEPEEAATEIKIVERKDKRLIDRIKTPSQPALPDDDDDLEIVPGTESNDSDDGKAKTEDGKAGSEGEGKSMRPGDSNQDVKSNTPVGIKYQRLFCSDSKNGLYVLSFSPVENCNGILSFSAIGEVGEEPISISSAKLLADGTVLTITPSGSVGPFSISKDQKNTIEVKLKNPIRFALGVSLYAN